MVLGYLPDLHYPTTRLRADITHIFFYSMVQIKRVKGGEGAKNWAIKSQIFKGRSYRIQKKSNHPPKKDKITKIEAVLHPLD